MTKSLLQGRDGAAAIEFAILAPVTLLLIFATLEAGWIITQSIMLDRGLAVASRSLQIGSLADPTYEEVRARVCREAIILADCETALRLEFTPIDRESDFPAADAPCVDRKVPIAPATAFNPGRRAQMVYVRACYMLAPWSPGLKFGFAMPHSETGEVRLTSLFAIVAPVILLLLLGCLAVFDMYRSNARLEQASLIVADMVSRKTALDGDYAKRLYAVFGELSETTNVPNALRLTSIANREGRYTADWSVQMGRADLLAPGGLYLDEIPALSDQDSVILIETGTIYTTLSSIFGIETVLFRNRKFIRPWFINATVFSG